jgi:hypothetical protein
MLCSTLHRKRANKLSIGLSVLSVGLVSSKQQVPVMEKNHHLLALPTGSSLQRNKIMGEALSTLDID